MRETKETMIQILLDLTQQMFVPGSKIYVKMSDQTLWAIIKHFEIFEISILHLLILQ